MVSFNRQPNTQYVSWFLDMKDGGRLNLDPPYQRRSVWNQEYKKAFIDTIIRNYPTQAIFIEAYTPDNGRTEYRVLDGKQRITSIIEFCEDKFETPSSLDDLNLGGRYFTQLDSETRRNIMQYLINVEQLPGATDTELTEVFNRLNKNVQRLNKQELRNAMYSGEFVKLAEEKSLDSFWENIGLITAARRRRMKDVEIISELLVVCMYGAQDGQNYLDDIYAANDNEMEEKEKIVQKYNRALDFLKRFNDEFKLSESRLKNYTDLYSLWTAVIGNLENLDHIDIQDSAQRMNEFLQNVDQENGEQAEKYMAAAVQGTNKKSNRLIRAEILSGILFGSHR